jgi:hypothetical protein
MHNSLGWSDPRPAAPTPGLPLLGLGELDKSGVAELIFQGAGFFANFLFAGVSPEQANFILYNSHRNFRPQNLFYFPIYGLTVD